MTPLARRPGALAVGALVLTAAAATAVVAPVSAAPGARAAAGSGAEAAAGAVAAATHKPVRPTDVVRIGTSVQGRPIIARAYGDPTATRVTVAIGQMHGNERGGLPVARRLEELGAPKGTRLWVIRSLNPDGLAAGTRVNAHGVDLNRNGPYHWSTVAASTGQYPGPRAMSEPETRAFVGFLRRLDPDLVLVFHQAGNGVDTYHAKRPALVHQLGRWMGLPEKNFNCSGVCRGTLTGWFNHLRPGTAATIELPGAVSTSRVRRWADATRKGAAVVADIDPR